MIILLTVASMAISSTMNVPLFALTIMAITIRSLDNAGRSFSRMTMAITTVSLSSFQIQNNQSKQLQENKQSSLVHDAILSQRLNYLVRQLPFIYY